MKLLERSSPKKGATKPMGHPTPIRISKRTAIVVALVILATLVLVLWAVPSVLISVAGASGSHWSSLSPCAPSHDGCRAG